MAVIHILLGTLWIVTLLECANARLDVRSRLPQALPHDQRHGRKLAWKQLQVPVLEGIDHSTSMLDAGITLKNTILSLSGGASPHELVRHGSKLERTNEKSRNWLTKLLQAVGKHSVGKGTSFSSTPERTTSSSFLQRRFPHLLTGPSHMHPILLRGFEYFTRSTELLGRAVDQHKGSLHLAGKAAIVVTIGVLAVKKAVHWFSGLTEMEHILDSHDMQYQRQAAILQDLALQTLGGLNLTALAELRYDGIYEKILAALDRPCHPQGMYSYSVSAGRSTGAVLAEVDNRIRAYRRKVSRLHAALPRGASAAGAAITAGTAAMEAMDREGNVLIALQRGVTIAQARQTDAFLRVTRAHLLTATNTLEDLLAVAMRETPALGKGLQLSHRLTAIRAFQGASRAGANKSKLAGAEKASAIQGLLFPLYALAARVQHHLDALSDVEETLRTDGEDDASDAAWIGLGGWVSKAAALASEAATLMQACSVPGVAPTDDGRSPSPLTTDGSVSQEEHMSLPVAADPDPAPSPLHLVQPPLTQVAASRSPSSARGPTIKAQVVDFTQTLLDRLTATVFGHSDNRPHSGAEALDTNAVIAQLALLVVHRLSTVTPPTTSSAVTALTTIADGGDALVAEFSLHADVAQVVLSCVVGAGPLVTSLEQGGVEVTAVHGWEPVHRNNLTFARQLAALDNGTVFDASVQNHLWLRELRYRSLRSTVLLDRDGIEYYLLQVLNPSADVLPEGATAARLGRQDGDALSSVGAALLAVYMDLSMHTMYSEGSNCTLRWTFSPLLAAHAHNSSSAASVAGARTRVRVTLSLQSQPGVMSLLSRYYASKYVNLFVQRWRQGAEEALRAIDPTEPLPRDAPLRDVQPNEALLLQSLRGQDGVLGSKPTTSAWQVAVKGKAPRVSPKDLLRLQDEDGTIYYHPLSPTESSKARPGSSTAPAASDCAGAANSLRTLQARADRSRQTAALLQQTFQQQRRLWRASGELLPQIQRAPTAFGDQLAVMGLQRRPRRGVLGLLRPRLMIRLAFWSVVAAAGMGLTKRSSKLSLRAEVVAQHVNSFVERRVVRPLTNILNDVVLNKRVSITDHAALKDAKRSLSAMLSDFLAQYCKSMSEAERRRIVSTMDMRPISEEYELELKRPMQSIVSGKIARLVLIQLQFVKKELLVAMQAIDDLFNANQVNLQLLAITPAVLSIVALNILAKTLLAAVRATSRGRTLESSAAVHRELREGIRALDRILLFSAPEGQPQVDAALNTQDLFVRTMERMDTALSPEDTGRILSVLHRLHGILVVNPAFFETALRGQLQEDLRDLVQPGLALEQRRAIVGRLYRVFPSLPTGRNLWGSAFMQ